MNAMNARFRKPELSSAGLHLLAMGLMLCDHLRAALFPSAEWLTCLGRLAFPIFSFLLAEGFARTRSRKNYLVRLLCWALLSEIPFDLMYAGIPFYPFHQNVLWTFVLSLILMMLTEKIRARFRPQAAILPIAGLTLLFFLLGYAGMTDYYGPGVLTPLVFYWFPGRRWQDFLGRLLGLSVLHAWLLGGYYYEIHLLGLELEFPQQALALLALAPICLYQGRRGFGGKGFRWFCYAFYPLHMALLFFIWQWVLA